MQPGTAGLTLTSDTDIDSHGSLVLALDTQNSASSASVQFTLKLLRLDAFHCKNTALCS